MHRGLMIPEIVRLIVEEIKLPPDSIVGERPDLRALAAFARTCTTFLEPGLDLLWSRQTTVLNLLVTFPDDLIRQVKDEWNRPSDVLLLRSVSPTDWERPLFYSRRVKRLSMSDNMWMVSTEAFEAISLSCPGDHMFPNLQTLVLDLTPMTYESQSATSIDFLISPQLKEIRLDFGTGFRLLSQIVPTMAVKCPSLTHVTISMQDDYGESELQSVSGFVRDLAHVEDLTVPNLDPAAFEHLGRLSSLSALRLENPKMCRMTQLPAIASTPPRHMYSSLTVLQFGATTVERMTEFIEVISNAPLEELEAESLYDAATNDVIGRLYSALAAHCSHNSLQRILIEGESLPEWAVPDQFRISGAILRTLFCFVNMVSVSLEQPFGFDLDDADIFDMARTWPRLEFLALAAYPALKPRVTIQGLYAFAQQCPNLDYLEITVDGTVVVPAPPAGSVSQHSLRVLNVSGSLINSPNAVATFLSTIFPQTDVEFDLEEAGEEGKYRARWEEVQQSITDLRAQKHEHDDGIDRRLAGKGHP
ncbi:hypothetical protein FB451DRAFT_1121995 [Mycena latifolia]|nr:hypothetical protein FB451DRAFT_1121995 [Mycena latifolia]